MSLTPTHRHRPQARPAPPRLGQDGLSLIEVMVGLVLGLLSVLVVLQVYQQSDAFRRGALGGDDANSNGALAMTTLQRELRQAGYGLAYTSVLGCTLKLDTGKSLSRLAPVNINHPSIPAGDAGTDTLLVAYGSSAGSPEGAFVRGQNGADPKVLSVVVPKAFGVGDQVMVVPPMPSPTAACGSSFAITKVTDVTATDVKLADEATNATDSVLQNLGPAPRFMAYAVRGQQLTACDLLAADCMNSAKANDASTWLPIGGQIVSLRAQYGRDTTVPSMDAVVDVYDQTTPTSACDWARVSAFRLALVARSPQQEATNVTTAAPTWAGTAQAPISLTGLADWQQFRYRTLEAVVPIRNITWLGKAVGC